MWLGADDQAFAALQADAAGHHHVDRLRHIDLANLSRTDNRAIANNCDTVADLEDFFEVVGM